MNRPLLASTTAAGVVLTLAAAACGSSAGPARAVASTSTTAANGGSTAAPPATVWLCRPGQSPDPCQSDLTMTSVAADGKITTQPAPAVSAEAGATDCFYVYPTVVAGPGDNAPLAVQGAITAAAVAQASPFSTDCRVWAPVYRQRTEASLAKGLGSDPAADLVAYNSVLSAWTDYLAHDNGGRPIVFIGHSQGAAMLIRLLRAQVDNDPAVRSKLVSAIILGGNVQVPTGSDVGGTFAHIPACRSRSQTGCVIAYSSFPSRPPADTNFGRPGQGVSLQSGQTASSGQSVLCTDPASLGGGTGELQPWFPAASKPIGGTPITTAWVSYPGLYTSSCQTGGGASWLQVTVAAGSADPAPRVSELLGPTWGYHQDDVNLTLGNLVADVAAEEAAPRN